MYKFLKKILEKFKKVFKKKGENSLERNYNDWLKSNNWKNNYYNNENWIEETGSYKKWQENYEGILKEQIEIKYKEINWEDWREEIIKEFEEITEIGRKIYEGSEQEIWIPLEMIRYSQRKINPLCQTDNYGRRKNIYRTIEKFKKGKVYYGKKDNKNEGINRKIIPLIEVVRNENKMYSQDNKRLYVLLSIFKEKCKENNKLIRNNEYIRKNGNDIEIKCIVGKIDERFLGKRKQAMYESMLLGEKNFDYKDVIVDENTKGNYLYM
jgi:hypothetical protein